MSLLIDQEIKKYQDLYQIFTPFIPEKMRLTNDGDYAISYGLTSCGYDLTLGTEFKTPREKYVIDPKTPDESSWHEFHISTPFSLEPNQIVLGHSVEYIKMPNNLFGIAFDKSTYARTGIQTNVTPLEPGWEGYLTIEMHNASRNRVMLYPNEGIIQVVLFHVEIPENTYGNGKYQKQGKTQLGRV